MLKFFQHPIIKVCTLHSAGQVDALHTAGQAGTLHSAGKSETMSRLVLWGPEQVRHNFFSHVMLKFFQHDIIKVCALHSDGQAGTLHSAGQAVTLHSAGKLETMSRLVLWGAETSSA